MKKIIFPLVSFLFLAACSEENIRPVSPFVGSWYLSAPDISAEISFDVVYEGATSSVPDGIYNYDATVVHPAIPIDQQKNNIMITYDQFKKGNGYGRIEITARGSLHYKIIMIYNRFTSDGISVYDVQIDIPGQPLTVLTDRVFVRR